MQKKEALKTLKELLEENKFISIDELFISITNNSLLEITEEKLLTKKEHPDSKNMGIIIGKYEKDIDLLISMLSVFCRYRRGEHYEILSEVIDKFINVKKNEMDGYGYIWRHISNYPLLLITYCLGISFLKYNNIRDLYNLMNKQITQRFYNGNIVGRFQSTLIEGINAYHVFNNIDNITVDAYQYFPALEMGDLKQTEVQKRLNVNNRIFNYLNDRMNYYFLNEQEFSDYFDLYEFFSGLVFIDKRMLTDSLLFAPYGRNYKRYSGSGRSFVLTDTIVHKFLDDTKQKKNEVLNVGFFGGKVERFQNALKEYQSLLSRIN